jgi:hypothetical protein
MSIRAAQELNDPDNGFGIVSAPSVSNPAVPYLSQNFTSIVLNCTNREDIFLDTTECGDNCTTTIKVCPKTSSRNIYES